MRRVISAVLMMTLLLCAGCSRQNGNESTAMALRSALTQAAGCRMVLTVNADCDGRIYSFGLEYQDNGAEKTIQVLSPETITGVSAMVNEDGTQLIFEDVVLDFGMPEGTLTTPLMAPYLLCESMKSDYIAYTSEAEQGTAVRYYHGYEDERLEVQVVIDRAALTPLTCEIFQSGKVILSAKISEFELTNT